MQGSKCFIRYWRLTSLRGLTLCLYQNGCKALRCYVALYGVSRSLHAAGGSKAAEEALSRSPRDERASKLVTEMNACMGGQVEHSCCRPAWGPGAGPRCGAVDRARGTALETSGCLACGRSQESCARCEHNEVHGRTTHVRILLALCCSNAASISCRVAGCMALLALS